MNTREATTVVRRELMKYRRRPYVELCCLVHTRLPTLVIVGDSGADYQVVIQVHWEGKRDGNIRIIGFRSPKISSRVPMTWFTKTGSHVGQHVRLCSGFAVAVERVA